MKTKVKKVVKYVVKPWEIQEFRDQISKLTKMVEYLKETSCIPSLVIYSADSDACIGMHNKLWHRIVCEYEGDRCLGGSRPHWQSTWRIDDKGFSLQSMENQDYKGWRGQYRPDNELKYDELPREVLALHHKTLVEHIKTLGIWYPCHIYNDFTGELSRP